MNRFGVVILFLFLCTESSGHGVDIFLITGGKGIEAKYSDGTPIVSAQVKVYTPQKELFQEGITDRNGRFLFSPDRSGKWKVEINDGMGHGGIKEIEVSESFEIEKLQSLHYTLWQKVVIGVSIIFGLSGIYLLAKKF